MVRLLPDRFSRLFFVLASVLRNETFFWSLDPSAPRLAPLTSRKSTTQKFANATAFSIGNTREDEENEELEFFMPGWVYIIMTTLYVCIFIVGIAGNLLVILVIAKDRRMRTTANFYLISLSVADLMIIAFCLPVALYELHAEEVWNLGPVLCKLAPLLQYLSTNASISTMVAISIERYIVVCRPLKIRTYCTSGRAFGLIVVLWLFSLACSSPLLYFTVYRNDYHHKLKRDVHVCSIDHSSNEAYFYFHQLCFYVLPGILLSIVYSRIVSTLRRFKSERFGHSPDSRKNAAPGSKSQSDTKQLIFMLSAVVLSYFVCLLPYNCIMFLSLVSHETLFDLGPIGFNIFLSVSRIMFFVNSCSNPIMYNALSAKFRDAFKKFFCPRRVKNLNVESRSLSMRMGRPPADENPLIKRRLCRENELRSSSRTAKESTQSSNVARRTCSHNVDVDRDSGFGVRSGKSDSFLRCQKSMAKSKGYFAYDHGASPAIVRTHEKIHGEAEL